MCLALWCGHLMAQVWSPSKIVGMEYPTAALLRRLEGTVQILCYLGDDGKVVRADATSGEQELADAAIRNAFHWTFRRTGSGESRYVLTYHFQIEPNTKHGKTFRFVMPGEVFVTSEKGSATVKQQ
jgi:hypothetical protein